MSSNADRAQEHLADLAHLFLDHAVQELGRARHDHEEHREHQDPGNDERTDRVDFLCGLDRELAVRGGQVAIDQAEIVDWNRLVQAVGDRLVHTGRAKAPRPDLVVDRRGQPVADHVVVGVIGVVFHRGGWREPRPWRLDRLGWDHDEGVELAAANAVGLLQHHRRSDFAPAIGCDPRSLNPRADCLFGRRVDRLRAGVVGRFIQRLVEARRCGR